MEAQCTSCGQPVVSEVYLVKIGEEKLCNDCMKARKTLDIDEETTSTPPLPRKYGSLRTLGGLYKFFAVLLGIASAFVVINGHGIESFVALVVGVIGVITLFAAAALQSVFMDTEENTREIARQLKLMNQRN